MPTTAHTTCGCKLCRVSERYELTDINKILRELRDEENASLRDMAEKVNILIVQQCLDSVEKSIAGDAASIYSALQNEDTDRYYDIQVQLNEVGISEEFNDIEHSDQTSVNQLQNDFVSYQTVRTHLQEALQMDTSRSGVTSVNQGREVIRNSEKRHADIVKRMLLRLNREGVNEICISPDEVDISLTTRVRCRSCGGSYTVERLLDERGCGCD